MRTITRQSSAAFLGLLVVCSVFSTVPLLSPVGAADATTNTLGGVETDGALRITVTDGNIGLERYDGSSWVRQYYSYDSSDTVLYVDGTAYDVPGGGTVDASGTELTVANQYLTDDASTIVTEFQPAGSTGLVLVQQIRYSGTQAHFDLTWDVKNTGDGAASDVRLLHGKDTYLEGGDAGMVGFWDSSRNTVGVRKDATGNELWLRGITDPSGYQSDYYGTIDDSLSNGALTDNVRTNLHDNGYAMEWRRDSIAGGETWTVQARESFSDRAPASTGSDARARFELTERSVNRTVAAVGQPVGLTVTVENVGSDTGEFDSILTDDTTKLASVAPVELEPGESHTYEFTLTWDDPGINRLFFGVRGLGEVRVFTAEQLRPGELTLRHAFLTRSTVVAGENYSVVAVVENEDDRSGTLNVSYRGGADGNESANGSVTLAQGDLEEHRVTRTAPSVTAETTLSWTVATADDENGTHLDTTNLTVRPADGPLEGGIVDAYVTRASVEPGEPYEVVAVVRNAGDQPQLFTVGYDDSTSAGGLLLRLVRVPAGDTVEVPHQVVPTQTGPVSWTVASHDAGTVNVTAAS